MILTQKFYFLCTIFILMSIIAKASYPYPLENKQNKNHSHRKLTLTKLITWISALSNSMKLWAMPCRTSQDRQVMVESSDKMWPTGKENGEPLEYACLENPMSRMKRESNGNCRFIFLADLTFPYYSRIPTEAHGAVLSQSEFKTKANFSNAELNLKFWYVF